MDSVVRTSTGAMRGLGRGGLSVFRGIPFAAAPEGSLRRMTRIWDVLPSDVGYPLADSYRIWAAHRG